MQYEELNQSETDGSTTVLMRKTERWRPVNFLSGTDSLGATWCVVLGIFGIMEMLHHKVLPLHLWVGLLIGQVAFDTFGQLLALLVMSTAVNGRHMASTHIIPFLTSIAANAAMSIIALGLVASFDALPETDVVYTDVGTTFFAHRFNNTFLETTPSARTLSVQWTSITVWLALMPVVRIIMFGLNVLRHMEPRIAIIQVTKEDEKDV